MNKIYLLFLLLPLSRVIAQDSLYFDRSWHETDREFAHYYRFSTELEKGKLWESRNYFFESNRIQYIGYFTSCFP